jgi:hypothetical protein
MLSVPIGQIPACSNWSNASAQATSKMNGRTLAANFLGLPESSVNSVVYSPRQNKRAAVVVIVAVCVACGCFVHD